MSKVLWSVACFLAFSPGMVLGGGFSCFRSQPIWGVCLRDDVSASGSMYLPCDECADRCQIKTAWFYWGMRLRVTKLGDDRAKKTAENEACASDMSEIAKTTSAPADLPKLLDQALHIGRAPYPYKIRFDRSTARELKTKDSLLLSALMIFEAAAANKTEAEGHSSEFGIPHVEDLNFLSDWFDGIRRRDPSEIAKEELVGWLDSSTLEKGCIRIHILGTSRGELRASIFLHGSLKNTDKLSATTFHVEEVSREEKSRARVPSK
jgi:hypothetical protein